MLGMKAEILYLLKDKIAIELLSVFNFMHLNLDSVADNSLLYVSLYHQ